MLWRAAPLGPLATELRDREPEAFGTVIGTFVDAAAESVMPIVVSPVSVPGRAVDI